MGDHLVVKRMKLSAMRAIGIALVCMTIASSAIATEDSDYFSDVLSPEFELEQDMPQDKLLRIAEAAASTAVEVDEGNLKKVAKKPANKAKKFAMRFKKMLPNIKKFCEVTTKMNRAKGRCRGYRRFCRLYHKFGLPAYAKRHCNMMMKIHRMLVRAHRKKHHAKKEKAEKEKGAKAERVEKQ